MFQTKPAQGYSNKKIITKSQPETIWHVEETPRRSGISACPVSPEDLSSQPFLIGKWDKERYNLTKGFLSNYQTIKIKRRAASEWTNKTPRRFRDLALFCYFLLKLRAWWLSKQSSEPFCAQVRQEHKSIHSVNKYMTTATYNLGSY